MHEDDGVTPVELPEQLVEGRIAQHPAIVLARQEHNAVQTEGVERILELAQGTIDVRER
jgi:hypothetical protein